MALVASCGDAPRDAALDEPAPVRGARRTWPVMREGDRGDDVIAARHLLRHRGHAVAGEASESDGRCEDPACKTFDAGVDAAVRSFQRDAGLAVDGIIGPLTWEALITEVRPGDLGAAVLAAQHLLLVRAGFEISIDGEAGEATAAALAQLAAERCLAQSEVLGVYGWSALLGDFSYCDGGPDGKLALAEVASHARDAGVPCGESLEIAVAVAVAESGLRAYAINRNGATSGCADGSADVGLWQINDCYHPTVLADCALDAACNARAMSDISAEGSDWSPWTTYRNGAYREALDQARAAAAAACR